MYVFIVWSLDVRKKVIRVGRSKKLETKSHQRYSEKQSSQTKTKQCVNIHSFITYIIIWGPILQNTQDKLNKRDMCHILAFVSNWRERQIII